MRHSSFLYPLRCPICDNLTDPLYPDLCPQCRTLVPYCTEPRCVICGRRLDSDYDLRCPDCTRLRHAFDQGRALWIYSGTARASVSRFKSANRRQYASFYAHEMLRVMGGWLSGLRADALVPVPVTGRTLRARGYNQSELLARALGSLMGLQVRSDLLVRRGDLPQQKALSGRMRRVNLQHAFAVSRDDGTLPARVILIDDIYTTGSTMDAAALALRRAGAEKIYAVYLCVGET